MCNLSSCEKGLVASKMSAAGRRNAGVDEQGGFENRCSRMATGGSNPPPAAKYSRVHLRAITSPTIFLAPALLRVLAASRMVAPVV